MEFMNLLKISALSGLGILLILILSPLLEKKHTVFWRYLLWIFLAIRLVLPFDFSIPERAVVFTLPRSLEIEEQNSSFSDVSKSEHISSGKEIATEVQKTDTKAYIVKAETQNNSHLKPQYLFLFWAIGTAIFSIWQFICYGIFCYKLKKTKEFFMEYKKGKDVLCVYRSPFAESPMLIGIRKPQILLPIRKYDREQLKFILDHELAHYKRKDLWVKLLLAAARTIHWFNPLVAVMERQAAKDMELLCDSYVVKNFTREEKKQYSETLLACASVKKRKPAFLCTSEFSKDAKTLKERFDNIFSGAGRGKGILAAALGLGLLLFVSFFAVFGASGKNRKDDNQYNILAESEAQMQSETLSEEPSEEKQEEQTKEPVNGEDLSIDIKGECLYKDKEGWTYYIEEDIKKESPLWEIAPMFHPLLLTRYRGEERQVLENLMYQEAWEECPVIFAEGRMIYKAAAGADIIGLKDSTLISTAFDGSDRKIADTIMYRVFDGVCEDNGWIYYSGWTNDGVFPRPLCRISPDFSGEAQFVEEIPGLLCGVKDGLVYYLAAEGKKPGVWKRNLVTGEEQIHDKWGMSAEEMTVFYAREQEFLPGELRDEAISGCHILFQYDYDGEMHTYDMPFYSDGNE